MTNKRYSFINFFNFNDGFSLIEVLIALFILTLIVFAFTPLLLGSVERIYYAGDKSEALYEGQSNIEVNLAEKIAVDGTEIEFIFGDPANPTATIIVPGGLVDIEETKEQAIARLSGFVPYIPNMNISPSLLNEGYSTQSLTAHGWSTDFTEAKLQSKTFVITDRDGITKQSPSIGDINISETDARQESATFSLSSGLKNSANPYLVSLSWIIEGDIVVTVHSRINIALPQAVTVGSGQKYWISPNALDSWSYKGILGTGLGTINSIIWTGFEYLAVTDSGRLFIWRDRQEPQSSTNTYGPLYSVTYGGGMYLAVGNNGRVVYSTTADPGQWSYYDISIAAGKILYAVLWSSAANLYAAVGTDGIILTSEDGLTWNDETPAETEEIDFRSIAYGNSQWLAVGEENGSSVVYTKTEDFWTEVEDAVIASSSGLNSIIYIDNESKFIVVGNSGFVAESDDGTSWINISDGLGTNHLHDIKFFSVDDGVNVTVYYIVVGDSGAIYTRASSDSSWEAKNTGIETSNNILGVSIR